MNSSYYKYCLVPQCKSTTIKTPNKLFIYVPNNEQIRKKWLKLARRDDVHSLSTNSRMYFCADHFDILNVDYFCFVLLLACNLSQSPVSLKPVKNKDFRDGHKKY
ncbi:hypothetical protein NQ317_006850 [Molorchus minor]|uniref:THAP-type domain-containing protein n=1 Tax=Molorchus minor TaxID=1323400 RepID=A0ABQ9K1M0_9CUCU|nr:hypothetical protein NQ317_006850 [Molorchus minor]